jgi:hypothetical protein
MGWDREVSPGSKDVDEPHQHEQDDCVRDYDCEWTCAAEMKLCTRVAISTINCTLIS